MRRVTNLADRTQERERKRFSHVVVALVNTLALATRYLDSRAAREFSRTVALMLPSLIDLCAKQTGQRARARGLADIYTAMQKDPLRAQELRAEGRALAAELGLPIFAPLFDDDATVGILDLPRIFNAAALADLAVRFKQTDTTP